MRRTRASKSTILRVLNGELKGNYPRVAKRHDEIRRVADELDYRPSYSGRVVARQQTRTIGLLYPIYNPKLSNQYAQTIHHLAVALSYREFDLALHAVDEDKVRRSDLLLDRRFDGYIVHNDVPEGIAEAVRRAKVPAVAINTGPCEPFTHLEVDDHSGSVALIRHLVERGHRSIAWVKPVEADPIECGHISVTRREAGYLQAMLDEGFETRVLNGFDDALASLNRKDRPTALVLYKSEHAARMVKLIHAHTRCRVPNDISVASFDDNAAAAFCAPALTVMRVPFDEFGVRAADTIVDLLEGKSPRGVVLPLTLVQRESVAAPHAARR